MYLRQLIGYGVILCFGAVGGSASAQSDPPGIPNFAAVDHQLALKVHDTGPASDTTGIFPSIIPQVLPNPGVICRQESHPIAEGGSGDAVSAVLRFRARDGWLGEQIENLKSVKRLVERAGGTFRIHRAPLVNIFLLTPLFLTVASIR